MPTGVAATNAELIDQHAGGVGELPVIEAAEVLVVAPPAELTKLIIGRAGQQHRIVVLEILRPFGEAGYFGWTHEREVLRVGVEIFHLPGNDCSVIVSNADWPFSSCSLKPGFTPVTLNASILSPEVLML